MIVHLLHTRRKGSDCILGLITVSTNLCLVRFRLHTWPTVSTYLCPCKVQTAYLAYCLQLPLCRLPACYAHNQESWSMRQSSPSSYLALCCCDPEYILNFPPVFGLMAKPCFARGWARYCRVQDSSHAALRTTSNFLPI